MENEEEAAAKAENSRGRKQEEKSDVCNAAGFFLRPNKE